MNSLLHTVSIPSFDLGQRYKLIDQKYRHHQVTNSHANRRKRGRYDEDVAGMRQCQEQSENYFQSNIEKQEFAILRRDITLAETKTALKLFEQREYQLRVLDEDIKELQDRLEDDCLNERKVKKLLAVKLEQITELMIDAHRLASDVQSAKFDCHLDDKMVELHDESIEQSGMELTAAKCAEVSRDARDIVHRKTLDALIGRVGIARLREMLG